MPQCKKACLLQYISNIVVSVYLCVPLQLDKWIKEIRESRAEFPQMSYPHIQTSQDILTCTAGKHSLIYLIKEAVYVNQMVQPCCNETQSQ